MTATAPSAQSLAAPTFGVPLIDRLLASGVPLIGEAAIDAFLAGAGVRVLFVPGDANRHLDSVDVAVILPELCRHFSGRLAPAVVARSAEGAMAKRFGVDVKPALAFFAHGDLLGTIPRVRDWDEYLARIGEMLARADQHPEPTRQ